MGFCHILNLHQISLDTVQSVAEHVHIHKCSGRIALSEGVRCNGAKAFVEVSFILRLNGIHFLVLVAGFDGAIDLDDINVEGDVEKLCELLPNLFLQIKRPHVLLLRVQRMLVFVPSVGFESVKHVVVGVFKFTVIIELFVCCSFICLDGSNYKNLIYLLRFMS